MTKTTAIQDWKEEVQGMVSGSYWMDSRVYELEALRQQMIEWGFHEVHMTHMDDVDMQFYNSKTQSAVMVNFQKQVDFVSVWSDEGMSRNDWRLVRRPITEEYHVTYLVPSIALYDIGTTHGFRRKSTILGYEEDPTGFESTMEILVNEGIAVPLGSFAEAVLDYLF